MLVGRKRIFPISTRTVCQKCKEQFLAMTGLACGEKRRTNLEQEIVSTTSPKSHWHKFPWQEEEQRKREIPKSWNRDSRTSSQGELGPQGTQGFFRSSYADGESEVLLISFLRVREPKILYNTRIDYISKWAHPPWESRWAHFSFYQRKHFNHELERGCVKVEAVGLLPKGGTCYSITMIR